MELINGHYEVMPSARIQITPEEIQALVTKIGKTNRILCVREARIKWGLGLRDAKDLVETVIPRPKTYIQTYTREVVADSLEDAYNSRLVGLKLLRVDEKLSEKF